MKVQVFPHVGTLPEGASGAPVVIDALRATSTIAAAFQSGATSVLPVSTLEEALARRAPGCLLAGERGGFCPPGFDLGNSPLEMSPERVGGKSLVLTTTNGTLALLEARRAGPVLCASFLNAAAVSSRLQQQGEDVLILCAGSEGKWSAEDLCVAGAIAAALDGEADDLASLARLLYRHHAPDLRTFLRGTQHGRYLCQAGFGADVDYCSQLDVCPVLPVFCDQIRAEPV